MPSVIKIWSLRRGRWRLPESFPVFRYSGRWNGVRVRGGQGLSGEQGETEQQCCQQRSQFVFHGETFLSFDEKNVHPSRHKCHIVLCYFPLTQNDGLCLLFDAACHKRSYAYERVEKLNRNFSF